MRKAILFFMIVCLSFFTTCENPLIIEITESLYKDKDNPAPSIDPDDPELTGISAVFEQGDAGIFPTTELDELKQYLSVTAHYDDDSEEELLPADYQLSGTLEEGESEITVTYFDFTDVFTVTVYADMGLEWPTDLSAVYGQTLSAISLVGKGSSTVPGAFSWTNPSDPVGNAGTQTHSMTFTPVNTTVYPTVTHNAAVTVHKADVQVTWPTGLTATYGQTLADITLPGNGTGTPEGTFSWTTPTTSVGAVGARTFGMTFTPTDTANYNTASNDVSVTVSPKVITFVVDDIAAQQYTGSAITPTVTVRDGTTALTINTDYTVAYSDNTNAGIATVMITGAGNYAGSGATATFAISTVVVTFSVDPITAVTYNGNPHQPAVVVKNGAATLVLNTDYTVSYTNNINAGTATVNITGAGNYLGSNATASFTINKADPAVTWPTGLTATYGQTLANITLPGSGTSTPAGTFTWTTPTTSVGAVGARTHSMTFTPADTANYNTITSPTVSVNVGLRLVTAVTGGSGGTATINDSNGATGVVVYDLTSVTVAVNKTNANDRIQWTASQNAGSFANATAASTTYTPPASPTTGTITLTATLTPFESEIAALLASQPAPVTLTLDIALGTMTATDSGWQKLLTVIETAGKEVILDLSACTMIGTTFNPVSSVATGKDKIVSITLPNAATGITAGAFNLPTFANFTSLQSVSGANITSVSNYAFQNLTSLKNVNFPKLTSIVAAAFLGCTSLELTSLPAGITSIGDSAFEGCTNLALTELPAGITTIGVQSFFNCTNLALTSLPAGLTSIGGQAFRGCTSLTQVTILATTPPTLGTYVFFNTHADLVIRVPTGSVGAYKAAENWSEYANKIVAID
jgi:hypothetical protein